ncbi:unnamed protein product [Rangifer tarandus platyrhynchus]|uniref:Uncharacterized protein n=1 Tax=Rangifer tarandus platyrhynchus TaxID=3082113 RepID=A0AC59Z6P5_RANTA
MGGPGGWLASRGGGLSRLWPENGLALLAARRPSRSLLAARTRTRTFPRPGPKGGARRRAGTTSRPAGGFNPSRRAARRSASNPAVAGSSPLSHPPLAGRPSSSLSPLLAQISARLPLAGLCHRQPQPRAGASPARSGRGSAPLRTPP